MSETPPPTLMEMRLAACILRARDCAGGDESSSSDIYWHTREACGEMARKEKIFFPRVVSLLQHPWDLMQGLGGHEDWMRLASEPLWASVMHPDLIVAEVLET